MPNCNHEKPARMVEHIQHALKQGKIKIQVRTVDTGVIDILVGTFYVLITKYL